MPARCLLPAIGCPLTVAGCPLPDRMSRGNVVSLGLAAAPPAVPHLTVRR
jgi:hypothetical protein